MPEDFFLMLIDGFFDIHHNMKCFSHKYLNDQGRYIACQKDFILSHKNLTMKFVLEGNFFELTTEEMFRCDGSGLCYSIVRHKSDDSNTWVLGGLFILRFDTTFDYEKKEIVFYSNKKFRIINEYRNEIRICLILCVLMIIGNIYLLYTTVKTN